MKQNVGKIDLIPIRTPGLRMATCTQKGSVKVKGDAAALWNRILEENSLFIEPRILN